jgi:hypothetical protein
MNIEVGPPFALTVNSGTGSGAYTNGVVVPIAANAPINGQYFDKWTGDTQYVASVTASNTTVTMPALNIALTATYAGESYYTLTITNGTGGGAYSNGTQVAIAAGAPPAFGYLFDQWTGATQYVASVSSASTTVTMPTNAVTLVATYKAVSVPPAEAINVSSTWSTNANSEAVAITGVSAAAGTNAAVSFNLHSIPGSWAAGGLYSSIRAMTLGPVPGDYISLNFTVAVATNTGTAVDLDRKLSFGLAGTDDKLWALFDTGLANGSSVTYGGYVNNPVSVNGPYLYRGDVTQPVPGITLSSVFTNGAGIALDTTYALSLVRTDTGAALYVSQIKSGNDWNSAGFAITNADAITLDKLFIGINGNNGGGDFIFTVTNLSLSSTYVTYGLTVNGGSGSGAYTNNAQVAIAANSTPGRTFVAWIGDTQYVASATASNTTVTMPANEITLTATYDQSILTVNGGTGGGTYTNGQQVGIVAAELPEKIFVAWTGDAQYVASATSATTTVTMPAQDIALTATYVSKTYVLTVYGGSGDGSYTNGHLAAISASTNPPRNFVAWIGDTGVLSSNTANTTVVMSTNAVNLTATFDQTILTVSNGLGSGTYTNGNVVAIEANAPDVGKVFAQWTGDTQYVASVTASNTTVNVPVQDISLTATYADAVVTYALTVTSGSGGGSYTNGQQVEISADVIGGKTFVAWTGDTAYVDNASSASATVTMPAQAVNLTATYTDTTYALTVTSGTGGGSYTNGQQVEIAANAPAGGYAFDKWTGDTQFVASASSSSTTVTMPAQAVSVTATYIATEQYTTNAIPVPYSWLAGYGITNNQNAAVLLDPDGDGLTTEQEYIAGTVPTNVASVLRAAQANRNVITWTAQSNRTYSVYWSTNLVKGFALKQDNIMYPTNNFTNSTPDSRINHYQIKVRMQ